MGASDRIENNETIGSDLMRPLSFAERCLSMWKSPVLRGSSVQRPADNRVMHQFCHCEELAYASPITLVTSQDAERPLLWPRREYIRSCDRF